MDEEKEFRKGGKKDEPTTEELEFIYERIQKLSDREILEEMQEDTEFPRRSLGFFKRRRRDFNAAKKVLGEQARREFDPVLVQRRKEHWDELAGIATQILSFWTKYSESPRMVDKHTGKYMEEYIIDDPEFELIDNFLADGLLRHLKAEFPDEFKTVTKHKELIKNTLPVECLRGLALLAHRKTFEGTCPVCPSSSITSKL